MANEKFKVKFGLAVGDTAATIDGTTGNIATNGDIDVKGGDITNSTGALNITSGGTNTDITITPNGTGDVSISADTLFIGDGGASANITTSGTGSLFLNTNNSVNSGSISIIEGVNGTISLDPNGTGVVQVTKNLIVDGDIDVKGGDITCSSGDLTINATGGDVNIQSILNVTGDYLNLNSDDTANDAAMRYGNSSEIKYNRTLDRFEFNKNVYLSSNDLTVNGDINANGQIILNTDQTLGSYAYQAYSGAVLGSLTWDGTNWSATGGINSDGAEFGDVTIGVVTDNTISTTAGNLTLDSTGGNIILNSNGTLGMTLAPITGFNPNADFTGNIVKGAIRTGAGEATGDIFQGLGGVTPSTGISIDNTDKVADRTSLVMRNYGASLPSGFPRNTIVWEAARGTAAAPLALGLNDSIGEIMATGYTSTGFVADQTTQITTGVIRLRAAEAWSSGLNNTGTQLLVALQPTATALTTSSLVATLLHSPQATTINSNSVTIGRGSNAPVGGATLTMGGSGTTGGSYLSVGDVNIAQMNSSWQTTLTPGFKYTGLMSSSTQNSNGSTFEMSSRWKAAAADVAYVIPQNGYGLGKFSFSADNTTNNSNQVVCGEIKAKASENWSNLTTGSKLTFNANKQGAVNDGRVVLDMSPETTNLTSDIFNVFNTTTAQLYNNVSQGKFYAGNPAGATFNDRTSQLRVQTASTSSGDASTIVFNTGNYNTGTGNFSPTLSGDTLGEFFFGGNYGTSGTFTTLGTSVRFAGKAAEDFTATNSGGRMVISMDKIGGNTQYDAITIDSSNASIASDTITLESNTGTDYAVLNSTSATFAQPVGFPVKTAAAWNAITGAVGRQVSVSDSPTVGGRMAFWDTTNARWSYVSDNTAV